MRGKASHQTAARFGALKAFSKHTGHSSSITKRLRILPKHLRHQSKSTELARGCCTKRRDVTDNPHHLLALNSMALCSNNAPSELAELVELSRSYAIVACLSIMQHGFIIVAAPRESFIIPRTGTPPWSSSVRQITLYRGME